jgi:hypothetical protein
MILLWGVSEDGPTAAVLAALEHRGDPVMFLNQHDVLEAELDLSVDGHVEGVLRSTAGEVELEMISGAYLRP